MNQIYEEFKKDLSERHPDWTLEIIDVNKVNYCGTGIAIRANEQDPVGCVVYPERFSHIYTEDKNVILDEIKKYMEQRGEIHTNEIDISREGLEKNLTLQMVNTDANAELLKNCPHIDFQDLSGVATYQISDRQAFVITNEMAGSAKLTPEEVMDIAIDNNNHHSFHIENMGDYLYDLFEDKDEWRNVAYEINQLEPEMYVISDPSGKHGASALLSDNAKEEIAQMYDGKDCFIFPRSQSELVTIPYDENINIDQLKKIQKGSNQFDIAPENFLSDSVYHLDGKTLDISIADGREKDMMMQGDIKSSEMNTLYGIDF